MYIIKRRDLSTYYYAGSDVTVTNVWTTNAQLATRFKQRQSALTIEREVAEKTRMPGTYSIAEIQVTQPVGAEVNSIVYDSPEWDRLASKLMIEDRDMY